MGLRAFVGWALSMLPGEQNIYLTLYGPRYDPTVRALRTYVAERTERGEGFLGHLVEMGVMMVREVAWGRGRIWGRFLRRGVIASDDADIATFARAVVRLPRSPLLEEERERWFGELTCHELAQALGAGSPQGAAFLREVADYTAGMVLADGTFRSNVTGPSTSEGVVAAVKEWEARRGHGEDTVLER